MSSKRMRKKTPSKSTLVILEPLEARMLMSAVIQLFGNSQLIANGASTVAATNFTNFRDMPTTYSDIVGAAMRTFQIKDIGDTDLNLTNGIDSVTISGANAGDFTVTGRPGATITPGASTNFTISFTPQGAGDRTAVVTIVSDDPGTPSYTFTIAGRGVDVTTAGDGLQIGILEAGSGDAAFKGSALSLNYVGYTTVGDVIDETYAPGHDPGAYVVGRNNLYSGWDEGLLGIQPGETRTIFVPTTLLDNSTVSAIYTFTAGSVTQPAITVKGGNATIQNGSTVIGTANNTQFGPVPLTGPMAAVSRTFRLLNNGGGDLWSTAGLEGISITGPAAGDFNVVAPAAWNSTSSTFVPSGMTDPNYTNFTVTFSPLDTGLRQATVTVVTNDPDNPTFTFDIAGTAVSTTTLAGGVEIVTTTLGSGTGAVQGSDISATFTGTLFNGTIFDSNGNPSTPTHLFVGSAALPPGLNAGLLGIQPGETRTIFVPASQGFGVTGGSYGTLTANAPLIYTVNALSFSAGTTAISVSGHGTTIAAGDSTPSATDFTDFGAMSTTVNATIGTLMRTYLINNTGGLDLTLNGSVTITGINAADFTIVANPDATIAAGTSSAFAIAFTPQGTGLRKGTVTISSNAATNSSYSFAIQGTGVATTTTNVTLADPNNTSQTLTYPLQIATTTKGTGIAAINGTYLSVNYTGYLLNGNSFDSSVDPAFGHVAPFSFALGTGQVIQGWEKGMLGIKPGETRWLFIPAGLGYGNSTQNANIPAGSTLIFKVSAVSESLPMVSLYGNSTFIKPGDTTPATADFTDFRFVSTTADAVIGTANSNRTFYIVNNATGSVAILGASPITISGPNAADFTVMTAPTTTNVQGGSYTPFTINFVPHGTGTRTATITVTVNDGTRTTYAFTVKGQGLTTTNNISNHLQYAILKAGSGSGATATVLDNATSSNGTSIVFDYTAFLSDGTVFDQSTYESSLLRGHAPISAVPNGYYYLSGSGTSSSVQYAASSLPAGLDQALVGMKVGETRAVVVPAALTVLANSTETGTQTYMFLVTRRRGPAVVVGSTVNNSFQGIAFGENSPSASDGTLLGTLPAGNTSGTLTNAFQLGAYDTSDEARGLFFTVSDGNARFTTGSASNFKSVVASDTVNGFRYVVTFTAPPLVNYTAHTYTTKMHIYTTDPTHPDFWFAISADVTPWVDLTTTVNTSNSMGFGSGTITSGAFKTYNIPVLVTNRGNVAVSSTISGVDFQIYLHPANATSNSADVLVSPANFTTSALRGLTAKASPRTVLVPVTVPLTVGTGDYQLVIKSNTSNTIIEFNTSNAFTTTQSIHVNQGTIGLGAQLAGSTFPASVAANAKLSGSLSISFNNTGNLVYASSQKITLQLVAIDIANLSHIVNIGAPSTLTLGALRAGGTSSKFSLSKTLTTGIATAGTYELAYSITPTTALGGVTQFYVTTKANGDWIQLVVT
jgi:FKBP-type peptidyl-prolyl cis-trans isomerase